MSTWMKWKKDHMAAWRMIDRSRLEKKLEHLTWKMKCVFVVFGIVVLAMVMRSVVMA